MMGGQAGSEQPTRLILVGKKNWESIPEISKTLLLMLYSIKTSSEADLT